MLPEGLMLNLGVSVSVGVGVTDRWTTTDTIIQGIRHQG